MGASGWSYFTPCEDDVDDALRTLRNRVFDQALPRGSAERPKSIAAYTKFAARAGACHTRGVGRFVVLGVGSVLVVVGALDLASRWVLGRDLVELAREAPPAVAAPPAPLPVFAETPLVTTLDFGRYTILAVAAAGCVREPACLVTLTIEPAHGLRLSPEAPYAFLPTPHAAVTYDAPPGKIRARERTVARAVVAVPARRALDAPRLLEGKVRVVTCDDETCKSEVQAITVAMPERLPAG